MRCQRCQFDNRDGIQFCEECGAKFERSCPACKANIPTGRKFCGECGHTLSTSSDTPIMELSFDEKLDKIQKYLPKGLIEKILTKRDRIEGERKQVTVMFCDLEGFTQLTEKLGPENAYRIMDKVYEILIHKVHDYDGTVNEMTGDGIMALFGAPIALEDAPQRAIRASLSIHREMAKLSRKLIHKKDYTPNLRMRIGIHTGLVVVGALGNDLRVEFKAVGDTVNLASRIETISDPGTTYVSEDTFKLTEGIFRFESLGQRKVKGKEDAVMIYQVIAPSSQRTRFDVCAERGLTPFIGRRRELEILLDCFERVRLGQGQTVSIISEAGLGKSRLLYEFRKKVTNEDVTFLEGKCLSYSSGMAYHPIIDVLKAYFDIFENEEDYRIKKKVRKALRNLDLEEKAILPYLLELLSVKASGVDDNILSPEGMKERILEALKQIVIIGSEIRPLILAFEDLHWIDQSSKDVLSYLIDNISGSKIFLIFTYRLEFVPKWRTRSYHTQVSLNRLSNRESISMAFYILGAKFLGKSLKNFILDKTEGIPLFIEEFVKSLQNIKVIQIEKNKHILSKSLHDMTVPSTIQDVIMARIDALPLGVKELLQIGSVIEREFSHVLIKQVTGLSQDQLLAYLSVLKEAELLYERGIYPLSTYSFKHALTREVVYDSILTKHKIELHEKIGNAIVDVFKDKLDDYLGVIATHYILSENYEKGAEFSKLAALKSIKRSAYSDAIAYSKREVNCLESLADSELVQKRIIDARTKLSIYCLGLNYHTEALEAVAPIKKLAIKLNYKKRLPRIYLVTGAHAAWNEEKYSEGVKDLEKALTNSEQIGDFISLWLAYYLLGSIQFQYCEFEKSLYHLFKAQELSEFAKNTTGMCFVLSTMSYSYFYVGNTNAAYETGRKSLDLVNESNDIYILAVAYTAYGMSCFSKGFLVEAENSLTKAVSVIDRIKHAIWGPGACSYLGDVFFHKKEFEKAQSWYNKTLTIFQETSQFPSWINSTKIAVASAQVMMDRKNFHLQSIYAHAEKIKMVSEKCFASYRVGQILINLGEKYFTEAEDWISVTIALAKKYNTTWLLARSYALYAELNKRRGDQAKAKETLGNSIAIFKHCSADGWVKKYEKELAEL